MHELGRPDLLVALQGLKVDLVLCDGVKGELDAGRTAPLLRACDAITHHRNHEGLDIEAVSTRFPYLGPGEANVLAWGVHLKKEGQPYRCVLDDKRARLAAEAIEVQKTGTIGLLRLLEENRILTKDERQVLETVLKETGFYYSE